VPPPSIPQTWTVWIEGGPFWTGGESINIPSLPGLGAPFSSFTPRSGGEGAFGFDYHWPGQPWHFVFDIRYGNSKSNATGSASSSSSSSTTIVPLPPPQFFGTLVTTTSSSSAAVTTERERHFVTDFMVGRDFGLGASQSQFQFGFRIADLRANASSALNARTSTTSTTFYSSFFPLGPVIVAGPTTVTTVTAVLATWNSHFFGAGPRIAVAGTVPIIASWSFDYGAGIAALIGDRKLDVSVLGGAGPVVATTFGSTTVIFNTDFSLALAYALTANLKLSAGLRGDYYNSALTTFSNPGGQLVNVSRLYWGPFARLTGSF